MRAVLGRTMADLRRKSYGELADWVAERHLELAEVEGASGAAYQIEVSFHWDDRRHRNVRVIGSIDENPSRPLFKLLPIFASPVTDDFIMRPDGSFIGE